MDDGLNRYVLHERTAGNPYSGREPGTEEKRIPADEFLMGDYDRTAQQKLDKLLKSQK